MICSCAPIFKFFYTPPDGASTGYQISNREFSDFLHTYYCNFLNNVYSYGSVFSCDKGQCDAYPAGIALPLVKLLISNAANANGNHESKVIIHTPVSLCVILSVCLPT